LVLGWIRNGRRPCTAELCERYGMSKQVVSRVVLGERWVGETVLAALVEAVVIGTERTVRTNPTHDSERTHPPSEG
jgi:hypothetical protein